MLGKRQLIDEFSACQVLGGVATPIHRSTLWRGIRAGRYPHPIKVGPGTNRWDEAELIACIEQAASGREAAALADKAA